MNPDEADGRRVHKNIKNQLSICVIDKRLCEILLLRVSKRAFLVRFATSEWGCLRRGDHPPRLHPFFLHLSAHHGPFEAANPPG